MIKLACIYEASVQTAIDKHTEHYHTFEALKLNAGDYTHATVDKKRCVLFFLLSFFPFLLFS